jgi:hypothetical protein
MAAGNKSINKDAVKASLIVRMEPPETITSGAAGLEGSTSH